MAAAPGFPGTPLTCMSCGVMGSQASADWTATENPLAAKKNTIRTNRRSTRISSPHGRSTVTREIDLQLVGNIYQTMRSKPAAIAMPEFAQANLGGPKATGWDHPSRASMLCDESLTLAASAGQPVVESSTPGGGLCSSPSQELQERS